MSAPLPLGRRHKWENDVCVRCGFARHGYANFAPISHFSERFQLGSHSDKNPCLVSSLRDAAGERTFISWLFSRSDSIPRNALTRNSNLVTTTLALFSRE